LSNKINPKFQALVQVHGTGVCQCYPTCHWCTHGWVTVDDQGHYSWQNIEAATDRAVVATRKGRMVGVLKYNIKHGLLSSKGTFVVPGWRKTGLATYLWRRAIRWERPNRVKVQVVTDRGKTLAHRLKRRWPWLKWRIVDGGQRTLRRLK